MLLHGDSLQILKDINNESIDLIVTDPPYALTSDHYAKGNHKGGFMGKKWDKELPSVEIWKECYRVLKPGKLAFIMCSPRQDVLSRMILNLEEAGFRTNYTSIYHSYASGFPKAKNNKDGSYVGFQPKPAVEIVLVVSKGKTITWLDSCRIPYSSSEPENVFVSLIQVCDSILGVDDSTTSYNKNYKDHDHHEDDHVDNLGNELNQYVASVQSRLNHSSNVLSYETSLYAVQDSQSYCPSCLHFYDALLHWAKVYGEGGSPSLSDVLGYIHRFALEHKHIQSHQYSDHLSNVDGLYRILGVLVSGDSLAYYTNPRYSNINEKGRFPANLLVSDDVLNDGSNHKSGKFESYHKANNIRSVYGEYKGDIQYNYSGDSGSYSRYFDLDKWFNAQNTFPFLIVPKASKSEKNKGVSTIPIKVNDGRNTPIDNPFQRGETLRSNTHPTVKPLKLFSYLITMGSRENDIILDPFCGSGTTLIAADNLARKYIGIEINQDYLEIAKHRLLPHIYQTKLVPLISEESV